MVTSEYQGRELLIAWKQPRTRERYLVGRLWLDSGVYCFRYERELPRSLDEAQAAGFRLFEAFPDKALTYSSQELFGTFSRRVPGAWSRETRAKFVRDYCLTDDQVVFEILGLTGGRVMTDTIEFLEPASKYSDSRHVELRFPVAGWRYYDGETVISEFQVGATVRLELELGNDWDPHAIRVLSPSGVHVGYVPAIYGWYLADFVDAGEFAAHVDAVRGPDDPQRRVRLQVCVTVASDSDGSLYQAMPTRLSDFADLVFTHNAT